MERPKIYPRISRRGRETTMDYAHAVVSLKIAGLSLRAARALASLGIRDPEDLRQRLWSDESALRAALLRAPNCGPKTMASIGEWLKQ